MEARRHILILGFLEKLLCTPANHLIRRVFDQSRRLTLEGKAPAASWTRKTFNMSAQYDLQHRFRDSQQIFDSFDARTVVEDKEHQLWLERRANQSKLTCL